MIVLNRSDFRGLYAITFPKLNGADMAVEDALTRIERKYLIKLLGKELFEEFESNPLDAKFSGLFDSNIERNYISIGLKETLVILCYFEYQRRNVNLSTENGRVQKESSVGTYTSSYHKDLISFNEAVDSWRAIQIYCRKTFKNFRGQDLKYIFY